jgi:hypothetical protein
VSASQRSFERQVSVFLGGMAAELPSGRSSPPQAMLRRARVHMTATAVVGAAFVAMTIILGTLATRGLLIGHGSLPAPSLLGGAGTLGTGRAGDRVANAGSVPVGVAPAGSEGDLIGPYEGFEGAYDRLVGRRGPDGGSWGGPVSRDGTGRWSDHHAPPPGSSGGASGGMSGSGGTGWAPPPPIWVGGTTGGLPPLPDPGLASMSDGGSIGDAVVTGGDATDPTDRAGRHRHGRATDR